MTQHVYTHRPCIAIAVSLAFGIWMGTRTDAPWVLASAVFMIAAVLMSREKWSVFGVHALFVLLGVVSVINHRALRADDVAHLGYQQRQDLIAIEGVVESEPWMRQIGRGVKTSFELSVERILLEDASIQKRGKVLVNVFRKEPLQYGDRIRLTGKLHRPFTEGFRGSFSYEDYLKRHGIHWVLSLKRSAAIELIERQKGNAARSALLKVRRRLQDVLDEHLTVFESGVIQSLVLGGRYYIPERMRELFVLTGTAHILAISGMNVGGMAFLIYLLFNVFRLPRRVQIALTCLLLVVYCLLTGANPSVVRATLMAVMVFGALLLERRCETLNSLGFAAVVILVIDPMALFDIGFQLSFAGVFFISWLYPVFYARINFSKTGGWGALLVGAFCISLAAFVGVLPLIAYHFQMITPVSIVANIPIIPFVSVLFMLGVGIVVTGLIFPPAAFLFAASIKVVLYGLMWIVEFFSRCPGGHFYVENFDFWMAVGYYILLGALIRRMSLVSRRERDNEHVHFLS